MNVKSFKKGAVIFRQGDAGDCMYDIQFGRVGIFDHYGEPDEKKIAELFADQIFGEMGLLDHAPRSATAVALENDTVLSVISEEEFYEYFEKEPVKILVLMQQMCNRLRRTSKDYLEACRTVHDTVAAEKADKPKSGGLLASLQKLCAAYKGYDYFAHN